MTKKTNWKTLDLEKLKTTDSNVVLGFKIRPEDKLMLIREAQEYNLTLSQFVLEILTEKRIFFEKEINELKKDNAQLTSQLKYYQENEILKDLFEKHKGKELKMKGKSDELITIKINEIKEMYSIVINSFKHS